MSAPEPAVQGLVISSGVNTAGRPFVSLEIDPEVLVGQLTPDHARQVAAWLLQAAEAAEHDSLVFAWATDRLSLDLAGAAQLIASLRDYRRLDPSASS